MIGPWLIVKWVGIAIFALYLGLILVAIWHFRAKLSRMRRGLYLPMVLGIFVSRSLPSIFEDVVFSRLCFVVGHGIYVVGITTLMRALARRDQEALSKADDLGEQIHSLKVS